MQYLREIYFDISMTKIISKINMCAFCTLFLILILKRDKEMFSQKNKVSSPLLSLSSLDRPGIRKSIDTRRRCDECVQR